MFVVDIDALAAVDALHFAYEVVLHSLDAADAQDIVRNQRTVHERVAFLDIIAGVDAKMFAMRHQVLALRADGLSLLIHGLNEDGAFAAPLFA